MRNLINTTSFNLLTMATEQIRTIDKRRLKEKMGHLDESMMRNVNSAIAVSFGLLGDERAFGAASASADTGAVASVDGEGATI